MRARGSACGSIRLADGRLFWLFRSNGLSRYLSGASAISVFNGAVLGSDVVANAAMTTPVTDTRVCFSKSCRRAVTCSSTLNGTHYFTAELPATWTAEFPNFGPRIAVVGDNGSISKQVRLYAMSIGTPDPLDLSPDTLPKDVPPIPAAAGDYLLRRAAGGIRSWVEAPSPAVVPASSNTAIPATADGHTYIHSGSSNITYTLPAASGTGAVPDGWEVVVSNQGTGDLTIDGNGSDTVDGRATLVLSDLGRSVRLQKVANGAWITIADTKDESGGGGTPDLRGSFDTAATPVAQDRFFFTDENQSGDPIRFVTFNNLQTALANLPTVVNVSADTAIPSTAHGDTYRVTGNTARTITLPDPDDLTVGFFVRIANGSASVSHSVAREGVGQSIEGGNGPVAVAAGEVLTLQLVNANEWEAIADTTKGGGGSTFTPTKANLYDAVKAILVHNAAVTADDADDELDIATGAAASIDDNSIAPVKAQAGTAAEKAAWRTRLGSTQVSEGSTLPAVADYNANDLRVLTADIASGISFRDVLDQSTVLTAARAGDVLMVFDIRGVKTWVRVGNMLLGSAVLRARIAAIEATAERRDVFGTITVTPPGIPGRVFPEFLALHLANKLDARALAEIRVSLNGIPIGAVTDTGLAPFNGLATVHGEQVGGTDGEEGGVVNLVINAVNRANLANNITTQPQWVTLELRYKFEGTALDTGTPADKIDRVGFAVNNAALRGLQLPPGGTAGQVLTKSGALSGVAEWATAGAGNLRATADMAATPASGDRFFFSDEGESGDPLRYVLLDNLAAALAPTVVQAYTAATQSITAAINTEVTVQTARITPRSATTRVRAEALCDTEGDPPNSGRDARITLRLYRGAILVAESVVGNTDAPNQDDWHNNAMLLSIDSPASDVEQTYTLRAIRHHAQVAVQISQRRIVLTEVL